MILFEDVYKYATNAQAMERARHMVWAEVPAYKETARLSHWEHVGDTEEVAVWYDSHMESHHFEDLIG